MSSARRDASTLSRLDALLFDLDGVITPTAEVHMRAWARLFREYFAERGVDSVYTDDDYYRFVDGRPRYDGVRALLASRGVTLPEGEPLDGPDAETVCGLGNRKNDLFTAELRENGVTPYPGSLDFLDTAMADGYAVAVVSSSRNAVPVLEQVGLNERFPVIVDGIVAAARHLPGKPDPDTFAHAAAELGYPVERCVVIEDAHSGVQAGRAGGFGLVVGVNRGASAEELLAHGADIVVDDLSELVAELSDRKDSA